MSRDLHGASAQAHCASELLELLFQRGIVSLTAIVPDGPTSTRSFAAGEAEQALAWLREQSQSGKNVYYQLNPSRSRLRSKARKADIEHVVGFHVDCDPEGKAKAPGPERDDWKTSKITELRSFAPRPTAIIDSGNGVQAIWLLDEAIEDVELAERINKWIAASLGAQPGTHDVSRLLRLPGFRNLPGSAKVAAGYKVTDAALISQDAAQVCSLADFSKLAVLGANTRGQAGRGQSSRAKRNHNRSIVAGRMQGKELHSPIQSRWLKQLEDLAPERLAQQEFCKASPKLCELARLGAEHPDAPEELRATGDRSALAYWFAATALKRGEDVVSIAAILLQPQWSVAEHIHKDGSADWRKVVRTIAAAIGDLSKADCRLAEVNAEYSVVRLSGKTLVARFHRDPELDRDELELMSCAAFRDFYRNIFVAWQIGNKVFSTPLGTWWLNHPLRRTYEGFVLDPTGTRAGYLNLWRGFGVEPREGSCKRMLRHIWLVLAQRDREAFRYIVRWLAWAVQNPGKQAEVALVFIGGRGAGKGTLGRAMVRLFGPHGIQIFSSNLFTGRFNGHLHNACLLFADEATQPENPHAVGRLKGLITEDTIPIERKGIDAFSVSNRLKVMVATNDSWAVPAGDDERRFAVFTVDGSRKQDRSYFEALNAEIEGAGLPALLWFLQNVKLGTWHPRYEVPKNNDLTRQKELSLSGAAKVFHYCLREAELPGVKGPGESALVATEMFGAFARARFPSEHISANAISDLMRKLGFAKAPRSGARGWLIPRLSEARGAWDKAQFNVEWDRAADWELVVPNEGIKF